MECRVHSRSGHILMRIAAVVVLLGLWTGAAAAQTVGSSTISGKAVDETGGAVPGVTVTASSPALQLRAVTKVTGSDGAYEFRDLQPGMYQVKFELEGFQAVVRDSLTINAGFNARVDMTMKVGQFNETVTVSGQSPVVDIASTTVSTNVTKDVIAAIPTGRNFGEAIAMAPGVRYGGQLDVGGSRAGGQADGGSNFGSTQGAPMMEGVNVRLGTGGSGAYMDPSALQEVQVNAIGNDAEVGPPGVAWKAVLQSGGNTFHGLASGEFQAPQLQASNIDATQRAQGVTGSNKLNYQWDLGAQLGGRIIRDRVWFFVSERHIRRNENVIGFAKSPGPDGKYGTADDVLGHNQMDNTNLNSKLSWQISTKNRFVATYSRSLKHEFARNASQYQPWENTWDYPYDPHPYKFEFSSMLSDRLMVTAQYGWAGYDAKWRPQDGVDVAGNPPTYDQATKIWTGPALQLYTDKNSPQFSTSVSYFPSRFLGGKHEFKAGFQYGIWTINSQRWNRPSGNYIRVYDNGTPIQIRTENRPVDVGATSLYPAAYIRDTWRFGRATVNLGLRWEHYKGYTWDSTKVAGEFSTAGFFPGEPMYNWTAWAPRIGVVWDITGHATTLLKAQWGHFNHEISEEMSNTLNPNGLVTTTWKWHDLNGNRLYDPGEVDFSPTSPDFVSIGGAGVAGAGGSFGQGVQANKNLKQPYTREMSVTLEHELMAEVSFRVMLLYKTENRLYENVNIGRPYSAWTIPVTRRDPGPDGVINTADDGGAVQLWDFTSNYRGSQFVVEVPMNRPSNRPNTYKGFEIAIAKRPSKTWDLAASFQMYKQHVWNVAIPDNPNEEIYPVDNTSPWAGKVYGTYRLPFDFVVAGMFNLVSGASATRTYIFRTADPLGGTPLANASQLTVALGPPGSQRLPNQRVLNFKLSRVFSLRGARRLTASVQVFNVLNSNVPTTISFLSGQTYGAQSEITPPRIARVGLQFAF